MFDEEFYLGQPGFRPPGYARDPEFEVFRLHHGDVEHHEPVRVGSLPGHVQRTLGWPTGDVFAHRCFAQKSRFHPKHPVNLAEFGLLATTIAFGDIFVETDRGGSAKRAVIFALSLDAAPNKYMYIPCYLESKFGGRGIFARTMFVRRITRAKFERMTCLHRRWAGNNKGGH